MYKDLTAQWPYSTWLHQIEMSLTLKNQSAAGAQLCSSSTKYFSSCKRIFLYAYPSSFALLQSLETVSFQCHSEAKHSLLFPVGTESEPKSPASEPQSKKSLNISHQLQTDMPSRQKQSEIQKTKFGTHNTETRKSPKAT